MIHGDWYGRSRAGVRQKDRHAQVRLGFLQCKAFSRALTCVCVCVCEWLVCFQEVGKGRTEREAETGDGRVPRNIQRGINGGHGSAMLRLCKSWAIEPNT